MNLYAESSAFSPGFWARSSGPQCKRLLRNASVIFTSDLTFVECDRVLIRAVTLNEMSETRAASCRRRLTAAAVGWYVLRIGADVVEKARKPFPAEPIRTLDALHLASAVIGRSAVPDLAILSLDDRIRSSAQQSGFTLLPREK